MEGRKESHGFGSVCFDGLFGVILLCLACFFGGYGWGEVCMGVCRGVCVSVCVEEGRVVV